MNCNEYYLDHNEKIMIGMLGPPSSGKDTVCDLLSAMLINPNKKMTEVAREYMEKNETLYSPFQQRIIFDKIKEREQDLQAIYQVVLNPGAKVLTYFYTALLTPGSPSKAEIDNLSDLYSLSFSSAKDYDYLFFCESLVYEDDGLRYQTDEEVFLLQDAMLSFLHLHKIEYIHLDVLSVQNRCEKILETIGAQKRSV